MARPDLAIGDALFAAGVIRGDQLAQARARAADEPVRHVAAVLLEQGAADEAAILGALDRCWDPEPPSDTALIRALAGAGVDADRLEALCDEAADRAAGGLPGRLASLVILRECCPSATLERAFRLAAQRSAAGAGVVPDDLPEIDIPADLSITDDTDTDDADDLPDLDAKLADDESGFERIAPTPASVPQTLHGAASRPGPEAATVVGAGGGPPPTLGGAPPTFGGGPPPTLFGASPRPAPDPSIVQDLPGWVLQRLVSQGTSGTTYEAMRESDALRVSLKRLSPEFAADAVFVAAVRTPAESARELLHDNIARVVEVQLPEAAAQGEPAFVAAEWTDGETIADLLRRARMPVDRVARIGIQAARALHQAHERGIVHGRVRPECVVLDMGDRAVVTGIGMPSLASAGRAPRSPSGAGATFTSYAPPEAAAGPGALDRRSDVYALGATLYEMMTGQPPFPPGGTRDVVRRGRSELATAPRKLNPRVPPQAEAIILQALAHEPNRRYATAQALAEDLERFRRGERVRARGAGWIGQHRLAAAGLALVVLAALAVPVWYLGFGGFGGDSGVRPPPSVDPSGLPAVALSPEQVAAEVGAAQRELSEGRAQEAARRLGDLLARTGPDATREARLLGCRAFRQVHDLAAAERELHWVLGHDGATPGPDARCERGLLALAEGRADDAVADLDGVLASSPEAPVAEMARAGKGEALLRQGKPDEARAVLEEAGTQPATLALLAEARLAAGDADAAVETARRAAQPDASAAVLFVLGAALEAQGKPEEAGKVYSQATRSRLAGDRRAELARERLRLELERLNKVATQALNAITQEVQAARGQGMEAAKLTDLWERCSRALDRATDERQAASLRVWRMRLSRALGKGADALADADALLSARPAPEAGIVQAAQEMRAQLRFDAGDFAGAVADASTIIERRRAAGAAADPNQDGLLAMLTIRGRAWATFGDFQAAARDGDEALAIVARQEARRGSPEHMSALVMSAFGNGWLGQAKAARAIYEQLKSMRERGEEDVGMALVRGAIAAADRRWDEAVREFAAEANIERSAYRAVAERSFQLARSMQR